MRKILSEVILTLILVNVFTLLFSTEQVNVEQREVGVKVGDWAKYYHTYNYTTNDPNFDPYKSLLPPEYLDIEFYKLEVESVNGANITFEITEYMKNRTERSFILWTDISYYLSWGSFIRRFFIGANLSAGDRAHPNPGSPKIQATLKLVYAGAEREVNYIGRNQNITDEDSHYFEESNMYWDRASGIADELKWNMQYTIIPEGYATQLSIHFLIKETNIWSPTYIQAEVNITPKILNLRSRGGWITACIKIPKEYDVKDINIATVKLNETIEAEFKPKLVRGKCGNSYRGIMVKFDRQEVIDLLLKDTLSSKFGTVTLTITGSLENGTQFQGSDSIKIIVLTPTRTWRLLRYTACKHFGSTPLDLNRNPHADLNEDGVVELLDFWIIGENLGKEWNYP